MKKILLILGNVTFNNFTDSEKSLFKDSYGRNALVHKVDAIIMCNSTEDAEKLGDDMLNMFDSYLVPESFDGEIIYDNIKAKKVINEFKKLHVF
jgi:hypothetical protein